LRRACALQVQRLRFLLLSDNEGVAGKILVERHAIRVHIFRAEKSFQDLLRSAMT
jgi:hypothetical protein